MSVSMQNNVIRTRINGTSTNHVHPKKVSFNDCCSNLMHIDYSVDIAVADKPYMAVSRVKQNKMR